MKVLITGTSGGIGRAAALRFLSLGHEVHGIDIHPGTIDHPGYTHHVADIRQADALPDIDGVEILFSNAGVQQGDDDISTNLVGAMNVTEKVIAHSPALQSILFNASASATSGQEFPRYVASKAALDAWTRCASSEFADQGITFTTINNLHHA